MTERGRGFESEGAPDWPVLHLPEDGILFEKLAQKSREYQERFWEESPHRYPELILQKDYHERYPEQPLEKTDAFIKWLMTAELLKDGELDTAEFHESLTSPQMERYFVSFQRNDNQEELTHVVWGAAHVLRQYVTSGRIIVFKPHRLYLPDSKGDA